MTRTGGPDRRAIGAPQAPTTVSRVADTAGALCSATPLKEKAR